MSSLSSDSGDVPQILTPTFWLGSTEINDWAAPRACFVLGLINGPMPTDFLLVRLDDPPDANFSRVALAPRYEGDSLWPVSAWPLVVNIFRIPLSAGVGDTLLRDDVGLDGVGNIYRSRSEAASTGTLDRAARGGRPGPRDD